MKEPPSTAGAATSWPATPAGDPLLATVHELFKRQVARGPERSALRFGDQTWTYRELDQRAGRWADALRVAGARRETLVGVMLERGPELVIAYLAILEAGGAYLPLDPSYPEERLRLMLEDADVELIVGGEGREGGLGRPGRRFLAPRQLDAAAPPAHRLEPVNGPLDLIYVIYTSGSTGRPKGVAVPQRAVIRLLFGNNYAVFGPDEVLLQVASPSFDASTFEIWGALLHGGCLEVLPRGPVSTPTLSAYLAGSAVTTLLLTTGLFHQLCDAEPAAFAGLRQLLVGGDAISPSHVRRLLDRHPNLRFVNGYGPTEAATFAACYPVPHDFSGQDGVPIGFPIANTRAHVLVGARGPLPPGEIGELYLGGDALARGYLRRPALSAARFVPDPLATEPGARLYRTGDAASLLADGRLLFHGRRDHQVKIRGFRVELGEIEACLASHPALGAVVVVAHGETVDERRLVAYVTARVAPRPTASELRKFLAQTLPDYMLPAPIVFLAHLPLTANGKVDRRALPEPGKERPELMAAYEPPRDQLEERLERLWSELLGLESVGVHDPFVELGGHSLLLGRMLSRLRVELGLELDMADLFAAPTLAELADRARTLGQGRRSGGIPRAARRDPIPLSFPQERVWFLEQLAPGNLAYNTHFTVRWRGPLRVEVLHQALATIVERHEIFRTAFVLQGDRPVQVVHKAPRIELPVIDLSALRGADRERCSQAIHRAEYRQRFFLDRIPLARWRLLRLAAEEYLLVQSEHHFVHDGWSLAVLLREIEELYSARVTGRSPALAALPIQYADFAVWQRRTVAGATLRRLLDFWTSSLRDLPSRLELPTDFPRPSTWSFRGAAPQVRVPGELGRALRRFSRQRGTTLFNTMMSGFKALLYRYGATRDLVVGTAVANRGEPELEGLIGMVVNTVILRTDLSRRPRFDDLAERLQHSARAAFLHQDVPLDKLVEELAPERDLSRNPLFQVMFSFHDSPVPDLRLPGPDGNELHGRIEIGHNGSAKADLSIIVIPRAEQRIGRQRTRDDEEILLVWEYSTDLFAAATIERMIGHYFNLLRGAVDSPESRLADLPILSSGEESQLMSWSVDAEVEPPEPAVWVPGEVARRAEEQGDAVAVTSAEAQLSYAELRRRSAALAFRLVGLGVRRGDRAAVCLERRGELIVALLAVLEAEAAYVPLEASLPLERLAWMIDDSQATAVLTRSGLAEGCPARVPRLELEALESAVEPRLGPKVPLVGADLAYVIYTSGSTGRPKGVAISHVSLSYLVSWHRDRHGLGPADRTTLLAGLGFDAAVWEIWPTLVSGATLCLPREEARIDPSELAAWLIAEGIDLAFVPTPMAERLLELEQTRHVKLRALLTGGDRLHRHPPASLPFALINHYGPTEATVVATAGRILLSAAGAELEAPDIGRPIIHLRIQVVDESLVQTPPGIPGELLLAGPALAQGYLRRPGATAERFVPEVRNGASGGRAYRTGDRVRYLADGRLAFLGRIDQQVKIRGFRIELGEIEAALASQPEVAEAVVLALEPSPRAASDGSRLVAFVRPLADSSWTLERSLRALARRLPSYMIPGALRSLAAFPVTERGKIDRRLLARMAREDSEDEGAPAQRVELLPRTPTEDLLVGLWSKVLGREAIGIDESFFDLGGHSLLATRVVAQARHVFQIELSVNVLFEAPTVAALARIVDRAKRLGGAEVEPLLPRSRDEDPPPPSFAQQRLWFLDRYRGASSLYNLPGAWRWRGACNVAVLEAALRGVVARHEALRTTFFLRDGEPLQRIGDGELRLPEIDLTALAETLREDAAWRWLRSDARQPFDLERGPLLRVRLFRLAPEEAFLGISFHHIVSDGWSMPIFYHELSELYAAGLSNRMASLPSLKVQYADYAIWQRRVLQDEALALEVDDWRQRLAGCPSLLSLPTDRPRPAAQSFLGARQRLSFGEPIWRQAEAFARAQQVTPFMLLLTVCQLLLAKLSGLSDFCIGTPIAGRRQLELENLIGFFVNTLVLRAELPGDPSFQDLLVQVRARALEAFAHQDLPFDKLVETLRPRRSLSYSPLFQVMLSLQSRGRATIELPGAVAEVLDLDNDDAKFDLSLIFEEREHGLDCAAVYARDLFDATTLKRWLRSFAVLLTEVLADPTRRIWTYSALAQAESHQLLAEWNDRGTAFCAPRRLEHRFAERARRRPDGVALIRGDDQLSAAELARLATGVARHLRQRGVGPEVIVGIAAERSFELVIGLLAILEAGGAFLPLDPSYPAERLTFMIADALAGQAACWLLCGRSASGALPEVPEVSRRELESLVATVAASPAVESAVAESAVVEPTVAESAELGSGDQLAYVIYTSGSTGQPKGVMVSHRAIVNHMECFARAVPYDEGDAVLHKTVISFDAALCELFAPLAGGARLVLASAEGPRDPLRLRRELERQRITALMGVPSWLSVLAEHPPTSGSLRRVLPGGDALSLEQVQLLEERLAATVINLYGPTEAAIEVTMHVVKGNSPGGSAALGRPIENVCLYVLDRRLRAVPLGASGELVIGGVALARGYRQRPQETAERFIPDPLSGEPGARLYRSGDLGRASARGLLFYLGRLDHQVKVRGFRIELGEIEACLRRHPMIHDAVVLAHDGGAIGTRLVGYAVYRDTARPTLDELRSFLASHLPEYMVPSTILGLDALPLTPSAKIDRQALLRLPLPRDHEEPTTPRSPLEERLVAIFQELLGSGEVGVRDDFFALGGHSLLAIRLVARLEAIWGVELPVRAIFEHPTVASLADELEQQLAELPHRDRPPLVATSRAGELPLSFAQERLWLLDRMLPERAAYNIPSPLRLRGPLRCAALFAALDAIVRRHEILRTTFAVAAGHPHQVVHPATARLWPVIDLSALPVAVGQREARRLREADAVRPFELDRGPLLRALLLRLSLSEHHLLLSVHHIVSDAWSQDVLWRELAKLYDAAASGAPDELAPLAVQYADYAAWQRRVFDETVLAPLITAWRSRLAGAPGLLELPADRPRPAMMSYRGGRVDRRLPAPLADGLRRLARGQRVTPFMLLFGALQLHLARLSGQRDLCVGTPTSGRDRLEVEPLIGFFVNTLILRGRIAGGALLSQHLAASRQTVLDALAIQDLPFERLVSALEPERRLDHTPLFQVLLAVQDGPRSLPRWSGLELEPLPLTLRVTKFDLSFDCAWSAGGDLDCELFYNRDLFDRTTAQRWLADFVGLLADLDADLERPVQALGPLAAAARQQLCEWNDTTVDRDRHGERDRYSDRDEATLSELLQRRRAVCPEAVAVVSAGSALSYGELGRRARGLASRLRHAGVGPDVLVGVLAERSNALVIALMAVLEAGGAYVPIDPSYPAERQAFMLRDSLGGQVAGEARPAVLLRQGGLGEDLPIDESWTVIDPARFTTPRSSLASRRQDPASLAYMIYTSGSTGQPKGAMNSHRAIVNRLLWMQEAYALNDGDRVLQKTPFSFDVSVWELFWPLLQGAPLVLARPEGHKDSAYLADLIRRERISMVHFVPSMLQIFSESGGLERDTCLRLLITSGEALPKELQDRSLARLPARLELFNLYGPTEAAVDVTHWRCELGQRVAIGRPVANTRLEVVAADARRAPIGVSGQLFLGGVQLARGYWRRPGLTAGAFVPDPFASRPGERLYRTGDLVRWRQDGAVDYLGRLDHQVKIRGFRVELGELESLLADHPALREVVAGVRSGGSAEARLVVYGVAREASPSTDLSSLLRRALRERLPEHLVPSVFVWLDELPRTPSGKFDRAALARLPLYEPSSPMAIDEAPRGVLEQLVARIWSEVLERADIRRQDGFFALGGHSLLAARAASRLAEELGSEIPLRLFFEAPSLADLARRIAGLLKDEPGEVSSLLGRPHPELAPLSFEQERLWFLNRLTPESAEYNVPQAFRLRGALDAAALWRGLAVVVERHEALRTRFVIRDGEPRQRSAPVAELQLTRLDLRALAPEARLGEARAVVEREAWRPFDLARDLPTRALLIALDPQDHLLLLTLHHIVFDGVSNGLLLADLELAYDAEARGEPLTFAPRSPSFATFAAWQREALKGPLLDVGLAFWRRHLGGDLQELALPQDRRGQLDGRGAGERWEVSGAVTAGLRALAARLGVTSFMAVLAAFAVWLGRLGGEDDLTIGLPVSIRQPLGSERMVGFLLNTMALRLDLSGDPTRDELLVRVRRTFLEAHAHREIPFDQVVEALKPDRAASRQPLFQVMMAYGHGFRGQLRLGSLVAEPWELVSRTSKFDLTLFVDEGSDRLGGTFEYRSALFTRTTMRRFAAQFVRWLTALTDAENQRLSEVPWLERAERHQVLRELGEGSAGEGGARHRPLLSLDERLRLQIRRSPQAISAVFAGAALSYDELSQRANRLARELQARSVAPDDAVGLFLERSLGLLIAVLGVARSGGVSLPLDPHYPSDRLRFMLDDAGAKLVIAQSSRRGQLDDGERSWLWLDREGARLARHASTPLAAAPHRDQLLYVIYTSGSTGRPKGAALPHRSLANLVAWQLRRALPGSARRTLQFTSLSFDVSFQEIFSTWCAGATLVLVDEATRRDAESLWRTLCEEGITRLFLPFVALQQLAEVGGLAGGMAPSLVEVVTAGEQLRVTPQLLALWERLGGAGAVAGRGEDRGQDQACRLENQYGPSESHVVTAYRLPRGGQPWPSLPPIGRPIDRTVVRVLGPHLDVLPIGVVGEVSLGGWGLARGYLHRPALTAARFLPDAANELPGRRLYRTGDRGRFLAVGEIEFLGRLDQQVKVQGFRVEPQEVEARLGRHPSVRDAVVTARPWLGGWQLVAYVIPELGDDLPSSAADAEWRSFLGEHLPSYMIPAHFVLLESFPLTASGKVDRRALPAPQRDDERPYVPPRNLAEQLLAQIWREALDGVRVGIHDSFFELGGHSLAATRVVARLRETLDVQLPLRVLFDTPTIAEIAPVVERLVVEQILAEPAPTEPLPSATNFSGSTP